MSVVFVWGVSEEGKAAEEWRKAREKAEVLRFGRGGYAGGER